MTSFHVRIIPYTLALKKPAATSRGTYQNRPVWYVVLTSSTNPEHVGIGECAPLFDLSSDYSEGYEQKLHSFAKRLEEVGCFDATFIEELRNCPSILFGFEVAWQHYQMQHQAQGWTLWETPFSQGQMSIPINGLVWMASFDDMLRQVEEKLEQGFECIKLKIGAIDFEDELKLLQHIRKHFTAKDITLRVDANGAFSPNDALDKLKRLAELELHSIEQPIRAGQWEKMADLVQRTPLPIALDEELIGVYALEDKRQLLKVIQPQYIILKPTLHGGFVGSEEWINLAKEEQIGWWVTSAMESNIGLNAIAQWCAKLGCTLPQGLGTGQLYTNNIDLPLKIKQGQLWLDGNAFFAKDIVNTISLT
ncbi:MAG: o-succinylbenzoate synthase [Saezia sp.]